MARRAARQKNQLPPCYYEGFLEKRSFKDKTSRKLWTCLCGNTLFFFNDKKDTDYIETLDLSNMISITDDSSPDRNLEASRLNLQMRDGNIKFTVPSAEARELWKGFIHSVAELSVPSSLNLLPGQIHMLKEVVDQERQREREGGRERERIKSDSPPAESTDCSPYISLDHLLKADMPGCYHMVSRLEAELLLEREAKKGNLLLRPGRSGSSFAITTRQDLDGSVFRHYRVTRKPEGGFVIDLTDPIPCATLHDVIRYLVENTEGALTPLIIEEPYDKSISFIRADNENGEKSVQLAPSNPVPPILPHRTASPRIPSPQPEPVSVDEEPIYLNDKMEALQGKPEEVPVAPQPSLDANARKKAIMPPIPAPRKLASSSSTASVASSVDSVEPRMRTHSDSLGQISLAALSELKLKLEQKARGKE